MSLGVNGLHIQRGNTPKNLSHSIVESFRKEAKDFQDSCVNYESTLIILSRLCLRQKLVKALILCAPVAKIIRYRDVFA